VDKLFGKEKGFEADVIRVSVQHPSTWSQTLASLPTAEDRRAEEALYEMSRVLYFALDFLTWTEWHTGLPKGTWAHEQLFAEAVKTPS